MRILMRRTGALGDVVLATPVLRRLRRENPDATIVAQTAFPDVLEEQGADTVLTHDGLIHRFKAFDRIVDLDLAYEKRPRMHVVEAYMEEAFGDRGTPEDNRQSMAFDRRPLFQAVGKPLVAVHAAMAGWRNRTLRRETWVKVVASLKAHGFMPVLVGTLRDDVPDVACMRMFGGGISAQARVINSCACFVGSDSGLLHVAGATDVPAVVGVFTCARPEHRLPFGKNAYGVMPRVEHAPYAVLDCVGCLERREPPVTTESCERGDLACVRLVAAEDIVSSVQAMTTASS